MNQQECKAKAIELAQKSHEPSSANPGRVLLEAQVYAMLATVADGEPTEVRRASKRLAE